MDYGHLPNRGIICINMKSFFASFFSVIRGLNSLKIRLAALGDTKPVGICCISCHTLIKEGIKTGSRLFDIPKKKDIT
ncbi:hypothetical protein [Priestia megaterium]|uniref:hypothetical protein n=1 Tax=Priestia megaterium TaxID=1404 RepID=UPI002E1B7C25|nr:hypothetical protein [Priestia megaterium]